MAISYPRKRKYMSLVSFRRFAMLSRTAVHSCCCNSLIYLTSAYISVRRTTFCVVWMVLKCTKQNSNRDRMILLVTYVEVPFTMMTAQTFGDISFLTTIPNLFYQKMLFNEGFPPRSIPVSSSGYTTVHFPQSTTMALPVIPISVVLSTSCCRRVSHVFLLSPVSRDKTCTFNPLQNIVVG